jgi:DNA-binding transcriptional ArsR family regulator
MNAAETAAVGPSPGTEPGPAHESVAESTAAAQTPEPDFPVRKVDVVSLKALAHPLRIQILEMLSRYGAQTACGLGDMLGESSGSTSYHLRQLAKHDFVREVQGKGTARERWWERPKGAIEIGGRDLIENPLSGQAARLVNREFEHNRSAALADFMEHGDALLPREWSDAATISTTNVRLTPDQLQHYVREIEQFNRRLLDDLRAQGVADGARPVQIHFNAFPLIDAGRAEAYGRRRVAPHPRTSDSIRTTDKEES